MRGRATEHGQNDSADSRIRLHPDPWANKPTTVIFAIDAICKRMLLGHKSMDLHKNFLWLTFFGISLFFYNFFAKLPHLEVDCRRWYLNPIPFSYIGESCLEIAIALRIVRDPKRLVWMLKSEIIKAFVPRMLAVAFVQRHRVGKRSTSTFFSGGKRDQKLRLFDQLSFQK